MKNFNDSNMNKIDWGEGNILYVNSSTDPYDAAIDNHLHQKKLQSKFNKDCFKAGKQSHMYLLRALSRAFAENSYASADKKMLLSLLGIYNSFMLQGSELADIHNIAGCIYEPMNPDQICNINGKYYLLDEDDIPQIGFENPETVKEFGEQMVAIFLSYFLYPSVDLQTLEERYDDLDGLCNFLETIAPDEYHAYRVLSMSMNNRYNLESKRLKEIVERVIIETAEKRIELQKMEAVILMQEYSRITKNK